MREVGSHILAKHSGQPYEKVEKDVDRDYWMSATEAKEYGIIDDIFVSLKKQKLLEISKKTLLRK
jgi:ATP-dependent Clp protease protease subunit